MRLKPIVTCIAAGLLSTHLFAQEGVSIKFGKVSPDEFKPVAYAPDSGAHAVVLAEFGNSEYESSGAAFQIVYKIHRRIRIMDKNGYDVATVQIPVYKSGTTEERLSNLKAASYNLEDGKVVETKLDSKNIFVDKQTKEYAYKKFTLPAVKEGTIIEYAYTITSDFYHHLRPWAFQGKYPIKWSEYSVSIPEYFDYMLNGQGYELFATKTRKEGSRSFSFRAETQGPTGASESFTLIPNVTTYRWALKDVPPIKSEPFITTIDNYTNRISFQLSAIKYPQQPVKQVKSTWQKLMEDLLKDEDYGEALNHHNGWLGDKVDELVKGAASDSIKAVNIFAWVRDNYTCTDHDALYITRPLKQVFNAKNGNVSEVNLLLVAMLKKAGLQANPLILSTRDNGYTNPLYPMRERFNYTIAYLEIGDRPLFLDASHPMMGFGRLPSDCYNGHARIVNESAAPVVLSADSLKEQKFTSVMMTIGVDGTFTGNLQQRLPYFESTSLRREIKEKGLETWFKKIAQHYSGDMTLENEQVEDLKELDKNVLVNFNFKWETGDDHEVIYLNPMMGEAYKKNPFQSLERRFPIEMPYVTDEIYSFNLTIPEGYVVDELPKSSAATFNDDEGLFQYIIQRSESGVQFRCRIKLNRATFQPEDYTSLRGFFDLIVKKQAEQIVLKKKKA